MRTFNLIIKDERFSLPTHEQATARDQNGARRIARQRLEASPHHVAIQVRDDERLLFWFSRLTPEARSFS
jgi:hypothetical protein